MAKPKTVTPPPPANGQDYIEMDRIPPRRGNPKETQRTVAILVGAVAVLVAGVGLKETVFKQRFDTAPLQQTPIATKGSKETVTDIPTGFTQGPVPIRIKTSSAKAGKSDGAPVPSPFGKPNAAMVPGTTSDADTTASAGTSGMGYDPMSMARSATSQPTVSMTPRTNTTDTGATGGTSAYPTYSPAGASQTGGGYTPTTTTPPIGTSGVGSGTYGAGAGNTTSGGFGTSGGTSSYSGGYGSASGSTTGTSGTGTGTSTGGYYGAPR